jgi:2-furoyl-CoA dehydrogenase FAD binding subunit
MKPAAFDLVRPRTLKDALALLDTHGANAKLIAGGQTLVPVMNLRLATPDLLIDLNGVAEIAGIRRDGSALRVGAMTRQCELLESPLVRECAPLVMKALPHIGHVQTRSRGTIGGSLAHADPGAELPLLMVALDATLSISSNASVRSVPAREFFRGAMTTDLRVDEVLTEIAIPIAPANTRTSFLELARRHGDFAIVAVAAQQSGRGLTVAVGGLEAVPRYCGHIVEALGRSEFNREALAGHVRGELRKCTPLADLHASSEYRRHLAGILIEDCLTEVLRS